MDDEKIAIFLCQQIMIRGFKVAQNAQLRWISNCLNTFKDFWQTSNIPIKYTATQDKINIEINADELDLIAYMTIDKQKDDDFSAVYQNLTNENKNEFILRHESHSHHQPSLNLNYPFDQNEILTARHRFTDEQLDKAISYLILHPFTHIHIKMNDSPNNHIRLSGGLSNAFLYLFHLRYQLCPIEIREPKHGPLKNPERTRLITLFGNAIRQNRPIENQELFEVPS